jgi:hypothetical protein
MVGIPGWELISALPEQRHWPLLLPAVGRRLKWRLRHGPVTFTLQSVAVAPSLTGRLRSVRITATDVDLDTVRLEHVQVLARDVKLRPASVSAHHLELRVQLGQSGLDGLLETGLPYAKLRLDGAVGCAELVAHPQWGHVELSPEVDNGGLVLQPAAVVTWQGARWSAPAKLLPRLRIGAEVLLPGSRLTSAWVADSRLHLVAELQAVQIPLRSGSASTLVDLSGERAVSFSPWRLTPEM